MRRPGFWHPSVVVGEPPEDRAFDGAPIPPFIRGTATLEALVHVDAGTEHPTYVGADVWLMKNTHVGHDCYVGPGCELAPGCILGGHAMLYGKNRLGIGAMVLPYRQIGWEARIGAGSVVTHNVPPGEVWAGNPARRLAGSPVYEGEAWELTLDVLSKTR